MVTGAGSTTHTLSKNEVQTLLAQALDPLPFDGRRILVIIPDSTRTAPIPLLFRLLYAQIGRRAAQLDYLIALGTHPPMSAAAIDRLVGVPAAERAERYPNVRIYNHHWDDPAALTTIGTIPAGEVGDLTGGLLCIETPVRLNKLIFDYDQVIICGPVFPHEVVGFSGGAKYLFPGIAGAEIIDITHWIGALVTSFDTIGIKDTPIRRVIHRAAEFLPRPPLLIALVMQGHDLHGLYVGDHVEAHSAAADLSAQLNILWKPRPFRSVLSQPADLYDEIWTAAKAMYKTEPVIADGGEVIIYAPRIREVSVTHGGLIRQVGYHVRDYFVKQWDRFKHIPWAVLAHSTHVRGKGTFEGGIEQPRIQVTLATGIPEDVCRAINLGYRDPATIDPAEWAGREDEGYLLVEHAGEFLYRLENQRERSQ